MDTIVITLRLPSELVEWVDSVGKRGAVVAEALESMRSPKRVALTDSNMDLIRAAVRETVEQLEHGPVAQSAERGTHNAKVAGSNPAGPTINMDALRSICAGNFPLAVSVDDSPEQVPCKYTEYDTETGETYGCRLAAHSGKIKHQRGPAL